MLVEQGFGLWGPKHNINLKCFDRIVKGKSTLYLLPGQAKRIFNMDETSVGSNQRWTNRTRFLCAEGKPMNKPKAKKAQVHATYVAVMTMPEYARPAIDIPQADGSVRHIEAVKAHDAHAWPGQVC